MLDAGLLSALDDVFMQSSAVESDIVVIDAPPAQSPTLAAAPTLAQAAEDVPVGAVAEGKVTITVSGLENDKTYKWRAATDAGSKAAEAKWTAPADVKP